MGFLESDSSKCRRHQNLRQLSGVCSYCLRDKLSKLSISPSFNRKSTSFISDSSSFSSTPPYSTASSSSATTGTIRKSPGHRRNGSEAYVSVGMVLNDGLKKSRSVSCASLPKTKLGNIHCVNNNEKVIGGKILENGNMKKKGGFLKKLIHSTSKKTKGALTNSKTMKERSSISTTTTKNKS